MDFDVTIYTNKARRLRSRIVDQGGNEFTELPPGAEMAFSSSDTAVCNPTPLPGGVNARLGSGEVGEAEITLAPGGNLTGDAFAPRTGRVTVIHSEPTGFAPVVDDEEDENPPPPPEA